MRPRLALFWRMQGAEVGVGKWLVGDVNDTSRPWKRRSSKEVGYWKKALPPLVHQMWIGRVATRSGR